jgi:putative metalloprotease
MERSVLRGRAAGLAGICLGAMLACAAPAGAQSLGNILGAAKKVVEAASVSDEQMTLYFGQIADDMDSRNPLAEGDDPYAVRLARLTEGLESHDGLQLDIRAYLIDEVNAFAMGDGTVRIYAGLMDRFDDDEVRCVIGHEIGHVKLRHGQQRMQRALQQDAALSIAGTASGDVARIANSRLGGLFNQVVSAQYSQGAERSADDYALTFMTANGYDVAACPRAMDKLALLSSGRRLEFLQTHPSPDKRARRMRKAIAAP